MVDRFKNYINGKWVDSSTLETFGNINPSNTEEVLGLFPRSGRKDIDKAVHAAKDALVNWKSITPPERGCIISEAARILASRKKELAEIISLENGKTISGGSGEVQSGIDMANFFADEGRRMYGYTTHSGLKRKKHKV